MSLGPLGRDLGWAGGGAVVSLYGCEPRFGSPRVRSVPLRTPSSLTMIGDALNQPMGDVARVERPMYCDLAQYVSAERRLVSDFSPVLTTREPVAK